MLGPVRHRRLAIERAGALTLLLALGGGWNAAPSEGARMPAGGDLPGTAVGARPPATGDRPPAAEVAPPQSATGSEPGDTARPAAIPRRSAVPFELDKARSERVWDAEHITFKLETYLNKPLMAAWKKKDPASLGAFFRDDAKLFAPKKGPALRRAAATIDERRWTWDDAPSVNRAAGIAFLADGAGEFARVRRAKMRVLYLDRIDDSEKHWRVTFWHEAEGVGADDRPLSLEAQYVAEIRFEDKEEINDGKVIASWRPTRRILRRGVAPLFEERTTQVGLADLPLDDNWTSESAPVQYRFQMAVEDFDRDGFPDIAIATVHGQAMLLHSQRGERFVDVGPQLGLISEEPAPGPGRPADALAGWIDLDNDGYPELILGRHVYRNEQGKRFTEITEEIGLKFDTVPLGVNVADYNRDGWLDLYVLYQRKQSTRAPRLSPWIGDNRSGARNELWLNRGGKRLEDATVLWGAGGEERQTFAAATFHLDDDLWPDLYLANDFGRNVLLRNTGKNEFVDASAVMGAGDYSTSMGVAAADLTNDGTPEVYVANMYSKMGQRIIALVGADDYPEGVYEQIRGSAAGSRLYCGDGRDEAFDEIGHRVEVEAVGWAYAPALVDVDGDGWLDIYATTGYMSFDRDMPDG